ncbi:MAG: RNA-binding S4 domain-containing protein, partial [Veillonella sp.]|nr:RNA-binding S4 domain-containing protein [Veillonella sp.]
IDDQIITINGQLCTEKRKKCYVGDIISIEGLDMDLKIDKEEE